MTETTTGARRWIAALVLTVGTAAAAWMPHTATASPKQDGYLSNLLACTQLFFENPAQHATDCAGTPPPAATGKGLTDPVTSTECHEYLLVGSIEPFDFDFPHGVAASDVIVKCGTQQVTEYRGLPVYRFRYLGDDQIFYGLMIDDVVADGRYADAVITLPNGYRALDYHALGLALPEEAAMQEAGARAMALLGPRG